MDTRSGDEHFGVKPQVHHRSKLAPPRTEPKTVGVVIPMSRPRPRGLDCAVEFAIGGSLSRATNASIPAGRGRKPELSLVVENHGSLFKTRGWSNPAVAGGQAERPKVERLPSHSATNLHFGQPSPRPLSAASRGPPHNDSRA